MEQNDYESKHVKPGVEMNGFSNPRMFEVPKNTLAKMISPLPPGKIPETIIHIYLSKRTFHTREPRQAKKIKYEGREAGGRYGHICFNNPLTFNPDGTPKAFLPVLPEELQERIDTGKSQVVIYYSGNMQFEMTPDFIHKKKKNEQVPFTQEIEGLLIEMDVM